MRSAIITCLAGLAVATAGDAIAEPTVNADGASATVVVTDFSGRPPFRRSFETLSVTELAALNAAPAADSGEVATVRMTDYRGRPPFRRSTETLPVSELAAMSVADEIESRPARFSGRPPFPRR